MQRARADRPRSPARLLLAAALMAAGAGLVGPAAGRAQPLADVETEIEYEVFVPLTYMQETPSQIVFYSNRDGNDEIYRMQHNGTGVVRLTNHVLKDQAPSWGPGQNHVVFQTDRHGNNDIYSMRVDGSELMRLTDNGAADQEPAWSTFHGKIAYSSLADGGGDYEIWVMNYDGTGKTKVTNNSVNDVRPRWSPVADRIAYRTQIGGVATIVIADGPLYNNPVAQALGTDPDWSPNGTRLVYTCTEGGSNRELCMINVGVHPSAYVRLTNETSLEFNPVWSPDGQVLAFTSSFHESAYDVYTMTLPIAPVGGASFFRVTGGGTPFTDNGPDW